VVAVVVANPVKEFGVGFAVLPWFKATFDARTRSIFSSKWAINTFASWLRVYMVATVAHLRLVIYLNYHKASFTSGLNFLSPGTGNVPLV
jgi:hypothetical protein